MTELSFSHRRLLPIALCATLLLGFVACGHAADSFSEWMKKDREQMKDFHQKKQTTPKVTTKPPPPPAKPKPPPRDVSKPKPPPEPEPKVEPAPAPQPTPKTEAKPAPEPGPAPTPKPAPTPEPEAAATPAPETATTPTPESEVEPEPEPKPTPPPVAVNLPNHYAVLIGVSDYQSGTVPDIPQSAPGVEAVRKALTRSGYPDDNIAVMTDEDATIGKVRFFLGTRVPKIVGENDALLIYFAGHGAAVKPQYGTSSDGTEKYLLLADSRAGDLYGTALTMAELGRMFKRIRSNRLIFIMDACFTSALKSRGSSVEDLDDDYIGRLARKGSVVLTASHANETTMISPIHGQSIFTYHLVEMLNGAGDLTRDGIITLDEGYRYIADRVKDVAERMGGSQHPTMEGELQGDFPLVRIPQ
jgi:hypothetical protein